MNWKKIEEKVVYSGWRGIIQKLFELPDGKTASFDVVKTNAFVTIAAFTEEKEAILVRQFRPGPEKDLASFPEGKIEDEEEIMVAAARELFEETGFQAKEIHFLKKFRGAYTTDNRFCVIALDCKKMDIQRLDDTEFIEVFLLPLPEFRRYLMEKEDDSFTNVDAGYLALDYLGLI